MSHKAVAVISESTLWRYGVAELLRGGGFAADECGTDAQLIAATRVRPLPTLLIDGDHVHTDCSTYIRRIVQLVAHDHVVVVARPHRLAALVVTAIGVEPHTDRATLIAAVRGRRPRASTELGRSVQQWSELTARQREVMRWLAVGCDNRHIAHRLAIGERAVKAHVTALLELFDVDNRTELALVAYRAGLRPTRHSL